MFMSQSTNYNEIFRKVHPRAVLNYDVYKIFPFNIEEKKKDGDSGEDTIAF